MDQQGETCDMWGETCTPTFHFKTDPGLHHSGRNGQAVAVLRNVRPVSFRLFEFGGFLCPTFGIFMEDMLHSGIFYAIIQA